jgi:hypothetical protein
VSKRAPAKKWDNRMIDMPLVRSPMAPKRPPANPLPRVIRTRLRRRLGDFF